MSSNIYKPTTKGMRNPQDNGSTSDMIVQPPRYAQLGGLKGPRKIGKKNSMSLRKPGSTEHR